MLELIKKDQISIVVDTNVDFKLAANDVIAFFITIFNDEKLLHSTYCPHVTSDEYINNNHKNLPLIYIWNENLNTGSFIVSVNGYTC